MNSEKKYRVKKAFEYEGKRFEEGMVLSVQCENVNELGLYRLFNEIGYINSNDPLMDNLELAKENANEENEEKRNKPVIAIIGGGHSKFKKTLIEYILECQRSEEEGKEDET